MQKKQKKLVVTVSFVDKNGNHIGNDFEQAVATLDAKQRNRLQALLLEATTGIRHKPL